MSGGDHDLIPRTGMPLRLTAGPKKGQRSLYQQQVLDEDSYTDALSHIITRDFFPNLPHIHATNAYLSALTNNDPELLSSSIRRLAALAQEKEGAKPVDDEAEAAKEARQREFRNMGTPYMSMPGGSSKRPVRTPVGARGWDTPMMDERGDQDYDLDGEYGELAGPSRPKKKQKLPARRVRDDLSLDAFQRNYTSEDNASFVQIVKEENQKRREERWGWAWEAEKRANVRQIEGEDRRKAILDAATSGNWRVDGEGRRLIGGLAEPGRERSEGEAWKERKLIAGAQSLVPTSDAAGTSSTALVLQRNDSSSSRALVLSSRQSSPEKISEQQLPDEHPLNKALTAAGLPGTALISTEDGAIIPHREVVSGSGEGRGRGEGERIKLKRSEKDAMGEEKQEHLSLGGSGGDIWGFKTRNNLMFPADANEDPYPKSRKPPEVSRQAAPSISHANTRLPDEDEVRPASSRREGSRRGSSPARSWVDAAVRGTSYRPGGDNAMPSIDNYSFLPNDPSPSPQDMPSLLTWGTLLATPKALDGSDDPLDAGPSFKLPETKRRDEIGRKLGDRASRSMNARAQSYTPRSGTSGLGAALRSAADKSHKGVFQSKPDKTPGTMLPPSSTPRRTENLTPAARQLLQRSMGLSKSSFPGSASTAGKNRSSAMEKGSNWSGGRKDLGGMSWTPSPARRKE